MKDEFGEWDVLKRLAETLNYFLKDFLKEDYQEFQLTFFAKSDGDSTDISGIVLNKKEEK